MGQMLRAVRRRIAREHFHRARRHAHLWMELKAVRLPRAIERALWLISLPVVGHVIRWRAAQSSFVRGV